MAHWHSLPAMVWLSSYVSSHCLAMLPQSVAKEKKYCTVYYKTLYSNCEAQKASKILRRNNVEDRVKSQN
jgi:hypothetical protein